MYKNILSFLLVLVSVNLLIAQNQEVIDSLLQVVNTTISDKEKIDTYIVLADEYSNSDSLKTVLYANKAIHLSEKIKYPEGKIDALYPIAWVTKRIGNYSKAEVIFHQLIEDASKFNYLKGKAKGLHGLGSVKYEQGQLEQALNYYKQSITIKEDIGDKRGIARTKMNIGILYFDEGNYEKALDYYFQSLEFFKTINDQDVIGLLLSGIGTIYKYEGDYEKALDYYFQALEISKKQNDTYQIAYCYHNIGDVYLTQEKKEVALDYALKALEIYKEIGAKQNISFTSMLIGRVQSASGKYLLAKKYLDEALILSKESGSNHLIRDVAQTLSIIEKELGNYQAAYELQVLFKQMSDSLKNVELSSKIARFEVEYEFQKKKDSIQFINDTERMTLEKDIEKQRVIQRATFIALGFLALLLLILFLFFQSNRRSNQILSKKSKELSKYLAENIAITNALDSSAIISVTDLKGRIIKVNEIFCEISGYTEVELLGQDHHILNSGRHPKDFWISMWKSISSGKVWREEVCNRKKNGELYWVDTVINPIRNSEDEIIQYLSIRYLITDRKKQEIEIKKNNKSLKNANEEINQLNAILEQNLGEVSKNLLIKNKKLEKYAFMNSHEIRSPIVRLLGLTSILNTENVNEDTNFILKSIRENAQELDDITRKMNLLLEEENLFGNTKS